MLRIWMAIALRPWTAFDATAIAVSGPVYPNYIKFKWGVEDSHWSIRADLHKYCLRARLRHVPPRHVIPTEVKNSYTLLARAVDN